MRRHGRRRGVVRPPTAGGALELRQRSAEHGADLLRELQLILFGHEAGATTHAAPRRLLELAEELQATYDPFIAGGTDEMDAARAGGRATLPEVVYRVPAGTAQFVQRVGDALRDVEEYARSGHGLLTLAPPADIAAYRLWSISEVERQFAGLAPIPWPEFAADLGLQDFGPLQAGNP